MAGSTPVVLDSSSPPPPFRHPFVTPQKSADAASSSPGLPEISTFFKGHPKAPSAAVVITPAVPAAPIATGLPGFTPAGTLWKAAALEAERKDHEGKSNAAHMKNTGKLARSTRKAHVEEITVPLGRERTCTPSISLSEFDFRPEEHPDQMLSPQATEKNGKRPVKTKGGDAAVEVRQPLGKAKEAGNGLPKASRKAARPAVGSLEKKAQKSQKLDALESHDSVPIAEMSAPTAEQSRRPSISISDYGYRSKEATPAKELPKASAYFSPTATRVSRSPKVSAALARDVAGGTCSPNPQLVPHANHVRDASVPVPEARTVPVEPCRKLSISLPEFDNNPDGHSAAAESAQQKPDIAKKPRKRTTDLKDAAKEGPAKKPRKRFTKSASIILNSDEPDPDPAESAPTAIDPAASVERIQSAAYEPAKKQAPKKAKAPGKARLTKATEPDVPEGPGFGMWSQSAYFNQPHVVNTVEAGPTSKDMQSVFALNGNINGAPTKSADEVADQISPPALPQVQTSFSRRRSWTPAKNTYEVLDPEVDSSGESPAPRKSLADLVGGFGYDGEAPARIRSPVGEPLTKKRRIEVEDEITGVPAARKVKAIKEKITKVKAPKKKPQTITELATKAYRLKEPEGLSTLTAQSTVSEFFTAQKVDASTETGEAPPNFKKPRKPRARKDEGEASTAKKPPRSKKVKVKFNEPAHLPSLLSPQQARAKEKKQGFLFGTSSQLALEQDVNYLRDLQMAIQQSEAVEETSSPKCLETKVSVGQAERKLFWCASRDSWGHVIAANGVRRKAAVNVPACAAAAPQRNAPADVASASNGDPAPSKILDARRDGIVQEHGLDQPETSHEASQVVDLCGTSPIAAAEEEDELVEPAELLLPPKPPIVEPKTAPPAPTATVVDDSWMLLEDDSSDAEGELENSAANAPPLLPTTVLPIDRFSATKLLRAATSPVRSQTQSRTALTALDSNIAMVAQTSPAKQKRTFASQASPGALKEPRGEPPKSTALTSAAALSPKRRGRPPKSVSPLKLRAPEQPTISASQPPPHSSNFVRIDDISDSDSASEDVPLKDVLAAKSALVSPRRRGRPPKSSQQTSPPNSSFVHLDDISDSETGKQTPSPRRHKAGAISPVQTLELSPSGAVDLDLPPIVDGKAAMKPTDLSWISVSKVLFPQITAVVKSTSPCGTSGELSWWEKILMYDPIVLEDLTSWLSGRGVAIAVRRKAVREKKKGRKKKGDIEEEVERVEEFEVVKEELKGWMVQKWCEEKSICCLWREGLRGGVRVRY